MHQPLIMITGASGFVGRHLVTSLKEEFRIVGLDWKSAERSGIPAHANLRWAQADITDAEALELCLASTLGGDRPALVVHLAAYYDFEEDRDSEVYWKTNVQGTKNILDVCVRLGIPRLIFASSLAACRFPRSGAVLTETSPPDGDHVYARTKRAGEELLATYSDRVKSVIVRFAAMFSDYCEYPPLFEFLDTWLFRAWNGRMIAGRGESAIPYLHIRDAVRFLRALIHRIDDLEPREVLLASPDGSTSHLALFKSATEAYFGQARRAIHIPRPLIRPGLWAMVLFGRLVGRVPFERPWMADYVDRAMNVDASLTRRRLSWAPRPRREILRRLGLLIENLRAYPGEWARLNEAAAHKSMSRPNLVIFGLLVRHKKAISDRLDEILTNKAENGQLESYKSFMAQERRWNHHLALTNLMSSVRTRERSFFIDYCASLAERREGQGFSAQDVAGALWLLERVVLHALREDPDCRPVETALDAHVSVTVRLAVDEVEEVFEELDARRQYALSASTFSVAKPVADREPSLPRDEPNR